MKYLIILTLFLGSLFSGCDKNSSTQEQERQELNEQYQTIEAIASSVICENANDWTFTAIGSKACGGPMDYIAYPLSIDAESFLVKVANYTKAENAFNNKWGVFSDCMLVPEPISLECIDGSPQLNY